MNLLSNVLLDDHRIPVLVKQIILYSSLITGAETNGQTKTMWHHPLKWSWKLRRLSSTVWLCRRRTFCSKYKPVSAPSVKTGPVVTSSDDDDNSRIPPQWNPLTVLETQSWSHLKKHPCGNLQGGGDWSSSLVSVCPLELYQTRTALGS